jgi:hypothetical protein
MKAGCVSLDFATEQKHRLLMVALLKPVDPILNVRRSTFRDRFKDLIRAGRVGRYGSPTRHY